MEFGFLFLDADPQLNGKKIYYNLQEPHTAGGLGVVNFQRLSLVIRHLIDVDRGVKPIILSNVYHTGF
jgi:hypothetical protein